MYVPQGAGSFPPIRAPCWLRRRRAESKGKSGTGGRSSTERCAALPVLEAELTSSPKMTFAFPLYPPSDLEELGIEDHSS